MVRSEVLVLVYIFATGHTAAVEKWTCALPNTVLNLQKRVRADLSTFSSLSGMATLSFSRKGTCVFTELQTDVSRHFFSFLRHQDMDTMGPTPKEVISKDAKKLFFLSSRNWTSRFCLPYDP